MVIRVLWFGKTDNPFEAEINKYRLAVSRKFRAEDLRLKAVKGGRSHDPRKTLAAEAALVKRQQQKGSVLVVLDEQGEVFDILPQK